MANVVQIILKGLDQASDVFAKPLKSFEDFQTSIGKLAPIAAAAAAGVAGALSLMVEHAISTADETGKMAQKVGVSVETLSTLSYAAKLADVDISELGVGIKFLSQEISRLSRERDDNSALARLGIQATDASGKLRLTEDVLLDVSGKFAAMQDGAEKTALAVDLFGRSGLNLIPFLNQGKQGIQELQAEARRLGLEISTETAQAAEEFNDNMTRLKEAGNGFAQAIAARVLPTLVQFSQVLVQASQNEERTARSADGVAFAFKLLSTAALAVWHVLVLIGQFIGAVLVSAFYILSNAVDNTVAQFKNVWNTFKAVGESALDLVRSVGAVGSVFEKLGRGDFKGAWTEAQKGIAQAEAAALSLGTSLMDGLGNALAENQKANQRTWEDIKAVWKQAFADMQDDADVYMQRFRALWNETEKAVEQKPIKPGFDSAELTKHEKEFQKFLAGLNTELIKATGDKLAILDDEMRKRRDELARLAKTEEERLKGELAIEELYAVKRQAIIEEEQNKRAELAQKSAELLRQFQQEQLDGAAKIEAELNARYSERLRKIAEVTQSEAEAEALMLEAYRAFEEEKTQIQQEQLDVRAELERLAREGNVQGYIEYLDGQRAADLADLDGRKQFIQAYHDFSVEAHRSMYSYIADGAKQVYGSLSQGITNIILGTQKASDVVKQLGVQLVTMVVGFMVQRTLAFVLEKTFAALGLGILKAAVVANVAAATALAGAWGAAATAATIATFGAAAATGAVVPELMAINAAAGAGIAAAAGSVGGIAHGGLDFVPGEQTFLLQRGERVVQPEANRDLTEFLSSQQGSNGPMRAEIYLDGELLGTALTRMSRDGRLQLSSKAIV